MNTGPYHEQAPDARRTDATQPREPREAASSKQLHEEVVRFLKSKNFYNGKIDKLVNSKNLGVLKEYGNYITSQAENGVHAAELGYNAGLHPGQPYPGKIAALNIFKDIANKDMRMNIYNGQNKPKRVWDALTGKYFMLPIVGAGSTAAIVATQNPEEQQIQ